MSVNPPGTAFRISRLATYRNQRSTRCPTLTYPQTGLLEPALTQIFLVPPHQVAELVPQRDADLTLELGARGDRAREVLAVEDDGARLVVGLLADRGAAVEAEDGGRERWVHGGQILERRDVGD